MPVFNGVALQRALLVRGWSSAEAAKKCGIARDTVAAALHGQPVRYRSAVRLLQALRDSEPIPGADELGLREEAPATADAIAT